MKKESKTYCTFCGEENNIDDLTCKKCHHFLKRGDHPLVDYMEDKITGKFQGEVKNTFFSILTNFIKSHLYGFVMTLSIFASAASVIVNNTIINKSEGVNYVEEKIVLEQVEDEQITYQGEGLTSIEVARKYVDALDSGDLDIVKGLQLETFYPEIAESIKTYQEQNKLDRYYAPAPSHHLLDYRDIYFKMNETIAHEGIEHYYLGESELIQEHQSYLGYQTDDYLLRLWYCSKHGCPVHNGKVTYEFAPNIQIQVILVDGNYYMLGEKIAVYMGQNEEVFHMALFRSEGDTTNLDFNEALKEYDSCLEDMDCIIDHGFNHLDILTLLPNAEYYLDYLKNK